jgi:hypothetical protein
VNPRRVRQSTRTAESSRLAQSLGRLSAGSDVHEVAWIRAALRDFDHTVGSIVPPIFDAYARVFHSAYRRADEDEAVVRWAAVAEANRRKMHPAAEWGSITGSWAYRDQPGVWDREPETGALPGEIAGRLLATLSAHTRDRGGACFGVWDGWGAPTGMFFFTEDTPEAVRQRSQAAFDDEVAAWRGLVDNAAPFELPQRRMHLLSGPLVAIEDFYEHYDRPSSLCLRNPPSLWWPKDASWCVGTDVDLMTTYVGASGAAIEALLADDQLEVLAVPDSQSVTWQADTINPLPAPP